MQDLTVNHRAAIAIVKICIIEVDNPLSYTYVPVYFYSKEPIWLPII